MTPFSHTVGAHLLRWSIDALGTVPKRRIAVCAVAAVVIGVAGAATMVRIVNPVTVLATDADRQALDWIRRNTNTDARFAVGVQPWIGQSFIGNDGGYWISVITDRRSILPPGLYAWAMNQEALTETMALLERWYEAQQTGDVAIVDTLRGRGVQYLYFGDRNVTPLKSAIAGHSSIAARVYRANGVVIYRLR